MAAKDKGKDGNRKEPADRSEDEALWAHVTRSVKKLPRGAESKKPAKPPPKPQRREKEPALFIDLPKAKPGKTEKGREVDRRTEMRVRRGQMQVEAVLDLHGMNRARAQQALESFLLGAYRDGLRHVLVITGKGKRGGEGAGVIKQSVPGWLEEPHLRAIVLQVHAAKPRHGGEGALYIYLRRHRD